VVIRKPNMNSGNRPYWISIACAQPGGIDGCGQPARPKRIQVNSTAHQVMLSSTAMVPARNSGRCGAAASKAVNCGGAATVAAEDRDSAMPTPT